MKKDNTIEAFFALIRGGLWEENVVLSQFGEIDYNEVFQLAGEQSVIGLVAAGIDHVIDVKPPKDLILEIVGQSLQIEQRNTAMNHFIAGLVDKMRNADIYTILVKGQGIAQCYERPLWRVCGDVDLLLSEGNYNKAIEFIKPLASSIDEEDKKRKHYGAVIDSWLVELHGTLHTRQLRRLNKVIDEVQSDVFYSGNVRSWMNGKVSVFLPSPDNDVFFVFAHIIQHYFGGGVGLRQICDWSRLLWTYRESIDSSLLEKRLCKAGMMTEWRAFAAFAIEYLGMSEVAMPLYSSDKCWNKKAFMIKNYILETGNFGHNRDNSFRKGSAFSQKLGSLQRYTVDTIRHFFVFPMDSVKVLGRMIINGVGESVKS